MTMQQPEGQKPEENKTTGSAPRTKQPETVTWRGIWTALSIIGTISGCTTIPAVIGALLQPEIGLVNMLAITLPYTIAASIIFCIVPRLNWKANNSTAMASAFALSTATFWGFFALSFSQKWGGITDSDSTNVNAQLAYVNSRNLFPPTRWFDDTLIFLNFYFNKYGAFTFVLATASAIIIAITFNKIMEEMNN